MDPPRETILEPDLFPDGQCRLIIIGKTGNGKSSTGNSILGRKAFLPQVGINSGTKTGDLKSTRRGEIEIQVMDTPGLHDTVVGDDVTSQKITQSLLAIYPGPHAIILCLSCDQRFTHEEVKVYGALKDIFGEYMTAHLIIVFSRRDVLEANNQCFENQLARCTELKKVVEEAGNRYVLFDNRETLCEEKKKEQVDQLLAQVQTVVVLNRGNYFTHKLTPMLNESMIRLKEAETESESEGNVYSRLDHQGGADTKTNTLPQSVMVLKDKKQVAERRVHFETAAQQQELTREEISSKFQRKPRGGATAATRLAPLDGARRPGLSAQPESINPPVEPTRPQRRPPRRPLGTPADQGKAPGLLEDSTTLPEKPPRSNVTSPTSPERNNDLEDIFQRFGFSPPTTPDDDGYSRIAESFVYDVPDRPGMQFSQKQRMVEERLKQRLARGGADLNPEQQRELEKTSRSLGQKLKEAAARFKVEQLSKCSVM